MSAAGPCSPPPALLVFAKDPVPGTVKTRLAAAVGAERATRVYTDLLATTLGHGYAAVRAKAVARIELWCTPDCEAPYLRSIATAFGCSRHRQCEGDLGARMAHAIADALARAPAVLLVGTDCPLLDPLQLAQAAGMLHEHDAVLGPAEDGGYVLVGARRPLAFDGVRWSTPHAFADTAAAFGRAGIRFGVLPVLWDVDEPADLARWDALRKVNA
ncbi:MAG: TIGR04282 family arsenosugar biosynthesis glycosyltransferase [Burkholderiales bacterium]|nr:TIGR04282 family arsenosugar biosynthesis glycosyltransferase [Burkholderiales bacterium]